MAPISLVQAVIAGGLAGDTLGTLTHPLVLVIVAAPLMGVAISARSLRVGPPVAVIAMATPPGIVSTIVAVVVVFGEPLPDSAGGIVLRVLAFSLVVVVATFTPPPVTPDPVER